MNLAEGLSVSAFDHTFDVAINRQHSWAEKYDARHRLFGRDDVLPLWVADMDFATPTFIHEAIAQHCQQYPVLGYTEIPASVAQVVCDWQYRQNQWQTQPDYVVWLSGVVSGIYIAIQSITQKEDAVMVFTPVYPPFMRSVQNLGRRLITQPLRIDDGFRYQLDFSAIEQSIREQEVKLLLLSHPHNPSGRVWSRAELEQLADICLRHQVVVVSDEVWCDVMLDTAVSHIPFASLSPEVAEQTITLNAPSKAFNIAALHTAFAIISNPHLKQAFRTVQQETRAGEASLFGLVALEAAYSDQGKAWLSELLLYLRHNLTLVDQLAREQLAVKTMPPQASYLLWMHFTDFTDQRALEQFCIHELGLGLSSGTHFGTEGQGFMRLNFALPRDQLAKVFGKREKGVIIK
jgi:cystathionine beta-lyase